MQKFIVATGAEYECRFCGLASVGILYVDIVGLSLLEALTAFSSPDITSTLKVQSGEAGRVFNGYTRLVGVEWADSAEECVRIALRKPYVGEVSA